MKALMNRVLYLLRRPLQPILLDRGLYCAAHAILATLFTVEAVLLARRAADHLRRGGSPAMYYVTSYLLSAVATMAVCICIVRIYERSRR